MNRTIVGLLFAIMLLSSSVPVLGNAQSSTSPTITAVSPTDIEHGDTTQLIRIGGRVPAGTSEMAIDITPLSEAGVDLSNASVAVNRSQDNMQVTATIDRRGERTRVRIEFKTTTETSFRLALRLRQLQTATADQTWVRYNATAGDQAVESNRFRIESSDMPGVGLSFDSESLILGQPEETQRFRVSVFDAQPDTPVSIRIDISSLREANVSLSELETDASVVEGDAVLQGVTRSNDTITVEARIPSEGRTSFEINLTGLDTRGATATEERRYRVTLDAPAGSKTIESESFGIYPPGGAPTPTETIWESPTQTETTTAPDTTGSVANGIPAWATGIVVIGTIVLGLVLRRRSDS